MSEAVNGVSSKTNSSQQKTMKHSKGPSWRGVPVFVRINRYRIMTMSAKVSFRGVIFMNRKQRLPTPRALTSHITLIQDAEISVLSDQGTGGTRRCFFREQQ